MVRLRLSQCVPECITDAAIWVNAHIDYKDNEILSDNESKIPNFVDIASCGDSTNIKVEEVNLEDLVWEDENFGSNALPYSLAPIGDGGLKKRSNIVVEVLNNHNLQNNSQGTKPLVICSWSFLLQFMYSDAETFIRLLT